ncbi:MAG TPA: hypothetical protein VL967_07590 [Terracidiphilus sp.]|nr:hypothetical protein [Terracidiphilus sp.]
MTRFGVLVVAFCAVVGVRAADPSTLRIVEETTTMQSSARGLVYSIKVRSLLPDGSHALLTCTSACTEVQWLAPDRLPPRSQECKEKPGNGDVALTTECKFEDVGAFGFSRTKDKITIYHRKGKTVFTVAGAW